MSGRRVKAVFPIIGLAVIALAAASWHSVEEIHYLKTFYPASFSVEEAYYASRIELIKIALLGLPLFLVIGIGLFILAYFKNDGKG